jgi:hypothetical protein
MPRIPLLIAATMLFSIMLVPRDADADYPPGNGSSIVDPWGPGMVPNPPLKGPKVVADEESPVATKADAERLLAKIAKAKRALEGQWVGTWRRGGSHAVLAVSDLKDGPIRVVHVRNGASRTTGFTVSLRKKNGVNSHYDVLEPEGLVVLAMKTNARVTDDGATRTKPVTYAPYSPPLDTPGMRALGRAYLESVVDSAAAKLDDRKVMSRTEEESLVTEVSPVRTMIVILLIEHMDHDEFFAEGAEASVNKVFTTIGLNGSRTYEYAFSFAGAGGLAQFIKGTYAVTRNAYPAARLEPRFFAGMRDHVNAVMAQFCLVDLELSVLPKDLYLRWNQREEAIGAYIASAYNGGSARTLAAIAGHPHDWESATEHEECADDRCGLRLETRIYLEKFHAVYRHLYP